MTTVEELRKAFAQKHVLKGVDWIFSLASALEERVERIELANLANAGIRLKEQEFLATVEERLEKLEQKTFEIDKEVASGDWQPRSELRRQDRWHATFNAVLQSMTDAWTAGDLLEEDHEVREQAHRAAVVMADRAHGPLEAKTTLCTHENYSCVKERQEVEALVKAIKAYRAEANRNDALISIDVYVALDNALKPFEAVKP